ncbi:uncharacterized protein M421DRAFT_419984 [Didymella exigua CBS 183.55]|uniref:Tetraspanin Tsp3 n=1 Tax=Didymella exigua CBS 183.55 TaxID=1150837 RepID=A0A6A5RPV9_9PLEO|nr:uncharacterized protein M421DRAFT_419984 [Didymella exigua CBS 183.55]KAF1929453.1 hypothetical protein M421DRAFT_419984 [Didymella exigua CBS 183.55]
MARYTRKQIVTFISIVYLVFTTAIAGYAASRANRLSVPISDTLTGFAAALPVISGILIECGYDLTRCKERRSHLEHSEIQHPPFIIVANFIIFIYSTVVITLLGTHAAPPPELDCGLRRQWQSLFRAKDSSSLRAIQDQYNCCGFTSSHDMAWPFPGKGVSQDACEKLSGNTKGCLGPWKADEQHIAGLLMGVVGLVVVWAFAIIAIPTQRESWLHKIAPEQVSDFIAREEHGNTGERRRINYLPDTNRYSDRVQEEDDDAAPPSPETRRALEEGRATIGTGLPGNVVMDAPTTEEWTRD